MLYCRNPFPYELRNSYVIATYYVIHKTCNHLKLNHLKLTSCSSRRRTSLQCLVWLGA